MWRRTSCLSGRDVAAKTTSFKGGEGNHGMPCGVLTLHRTCSQATTRRTGLALDDRATCPWKHRVGCRGCAGTTGRNSHGHPAAANVSIFVCFVGAMVSSAVSSVLYLRDMVGEHTACIHNGDAASVHEWECRTSLRSAGEASDHYTEEVSTECERLRGDVFVAAQVAGFDSIYEIADGTPRSIDTLIWHMRFFVFPITEHESKEFVSSTVVREDRCQDNKEQV